MDVTEAATHLPLSVEEYLAFEAGSRVRHEYVGGVVHAMAGESVAHNAIALNIAAALRAKLRGGPCRVLMENVKLRVEVARDDVFYYPDVMVVCTQLGVERDFVRFPTVLVEVLSPSTEAIDRREKKMVYQQLPMLEEYVLVAQDRREVTVFRRANQWRPEVLTAAEAVLELRSIKQALSVAEVYEDVF